MNNAVNLEKLSKSFTIVKRNWLHAESHQVVAVDAINLEVKHGEAVAFIGPNGAGKSTTIKMLTGILHPTSGNASVLGFCPWKDRAKLAYQIGAVFGQRSQLWYHLPPTDTFDLLARIYNLNQKDYLQRRNMLIERFSLGSFLSTPVRKLSLGQRMRAEVAASLLHKPKVLFLDEPTIGLDVVARQQLRDLISEWNREEGLTVLLTSHDVGDIESVARRVVVINHGRIVLDDDIAVVRQKYLNEKVLSVTFHSPVEMIKIQGAKIQKSSEYSFDIEIDTQSLPIEQIISEVLKAGAVADITIEDPPLEEVITHIYSSKFLS